MSVLAAKQRFYGANHDTKHGEPEDAVLDPLPRGADDAGTKPDFGMRRWTFEFQASIVRSDGKSTNGLKAGLVAEPAGRCTRSFVT